MIGPISTIHHIGPILLIYFITLFVIFLIKKQIIKFCPKTISIVTLISKITMIAVTIAMVLTVVIVFGFLSNPFERAKIKTISPAIIDETFNPKPLNEIRMENEEVINKKHIEKEVEATTDNQKAFEDSKNIFK